jgi:hypothetical protein
MIREFAHAGHPIQALNSLDIIAMKTTQAVPKWKTGVVNHELGSPNFLTLNSDFILIHMGVCYEGNQRTAEHRKTDRDKGAVADMHHG